MASTQCSERNLNLMADVYRYGGLDHAETLKHFSERGGRFASPHTGAGLDLPFDQGGGSAMMSGSGASKSDDAKQWKMRAHNVDKKLCLPSEKSI